MIACSVAPTLLHPVPKAHYFLM
ncbi:BgTH12-05143 [Blumeria graminis f. sp. triticale]|uniref:BgTH12-05143 n=1 Tax=Blumeria graminis f. sp. triticale TaxID=1689686 RepID=A0A9W4GEH1_BLUGR|nr:BgTH12-05143 [Blumeria graminis f. sp. triticale]